MNKQSSPPLLRFVASVLFLAVSTLSWAYDFESDGIYYRINYDGTSVSVTYASTDYNSYSGSVVIPSAVTYDSQEYSVTGIGNNAFCECPNLTSVTIPNSVTAISQAAFNGCTSLTSVTFPSSLTNFSNYVFYECTSLTSIDLPEGITEIGNYTFYKCTGLKSVTIPSTVTSIGARAFGNCSALEEITCLAEQVPETSSLAFQSASISSASLYVPSSARSSYQSAEPWSGFGTVTSVPYDFVSDGIYYKINADGVSVSVSYKNTNYNSYSGLVEIPSTVTYDSRDYRVTAIGRDAFRGCTSLTSVIIPNSVTEIGYEAFIDCASLTSVTIPESVTYIDSEAFRSCTGLTSVTIPNNVTSISYGTFMNSNIQSVTIGTGVTAIRQNAFAGCSALKEVLCLAEQVPETHADAFKNTDISSATLIVSESALSSYKSTAPWKNFGNKYAIAYDFEAGGIYYKINEDGNSVSVSPRVTDSDYKSYSTSVDIPSTVTYNGKQYSVTAIGQDAFRNCTSITYVKIPNSVTSIGQRAFLNCHIMNVTIPEGVTSIEQDVFNGCYNLTSITIPNGVTRIGDRAFYGCNGLTSVTIPDKVTSIGQSAFSNCKFLTSVMIGSGVSQIGQYAFGSCEALKEVWCYAQQVPETHADAFADSNISSAILYVPEFSKYESTAPWSDFDIYRFPYNFEVDGIYYKFIHGDETSVSVSYKNKDYNSYSGSVVIPSTVTYDGKKYNVTAIGTGAFRGCTSLTSVKIPNSVTEIWYQAFFNCTSLTSITIPESVIDIDNEAFRECPGLTSVTIPNNVTKIKYGTFMYSNIQSVTIGTGVTEIEECAFYGCPALKEVYCLAEQVPETHADAFKNTDISLATLFVSESALSSYKSATPWKNFGNKYAIAYDFEVDGIYYKFNDDGTSVSVAPRVTDYKYYYSYSGSVKIPSYVRYNNVQYNVNAIGQNAFRNCFDLTELTIPEGITSLEQSSISGCRALTELTIPNSVTSIGDYALYDCTGLKTLTIGSGVTEIGQFAFTYCPFTEVYCKAKQVPNTHSEAFVGSNIASATLQVPESAYDAYKSTAPWSGFGSFNSVSYDLVAKGIYYRFNDEGNGFVVTYGSKDYNSYSGSVVIPAVVDYSGWAYNVTGIGYDAFRDCTSLTSVTIPNSVTTIMQRAFYGCEALESITIPNSVITIKRDAFINCDALTSVTIPESVTSIGQTVFYDCDALKSVTIGRGVTSIGDRAFAYNSALKEVFCLAEQVPDTHTDAFKFSNMTSATLYVPESAVDAYKAASPWSGFGKITSLAYDFEADGICYKINGDGTSVSVAQRVSEYNYESYTGTVVIPATVTYNAMRYDVTRIGENAFRDCFNLTSLTIPEGVKSLEKASLSDCRALTELTIPNSVTRIADFALYDCTGLKTLTIGSGVIQVGQYAFTYCESLAKVYCYANQVPDAHAQAFVGSSIASATLYVPESSVDTYKDTTPWSGFGTVASLGYDFEADGIYYKFNDDDTSVSVTYNAINNNHSSVVVEIPSAVTHDGTEYSVTAIGPSAFRNCIMLISIAIPNSVTVIGNEAFNYCERLQEVTIPNSVTRIGDYAFSNSSLEYVTIGSGITTIGTKAFANCTGLKEVYCMAEQVPAANLYAFQNTGIASGILYVPESAVSVYAATDPWSQFGLVTSIASTYDFVADGIYYKYNDDGTSVSVTSYSTGSKVASYSGTVVIPAAVTYGDKQYDVTCIDEEAFRYCSTLTSVTIPESITSIGQYAFVECKRLKKVYCMAKQVPETDVDAFTNSGSKDATLYVPYSAYDAYKSAEPWKGFGKITSLAYDFEVDGIYYRINGSWVYVTYRNTEYNSYSGSVVIPSSVSYGGIKYRVNYIGNRAFSNCPDLTSVTIPNNVKLEIHSNAFEKCSALKSIVIPDGVDNIYPDAFSGCSALESVTIHGSVKVINGGAFANCPVLKVVKCLAEEVPNTNLTAFNSSSIGFATLYVPESAVEAYRAAAPWSGFATIAALEPEYIVGDANGNGEVEIGDVTSVLTLMATPEATGYNNKAADANGNGEIEIGDVTTILTIMANGGQ